MYIAVHNCGIAACIASHRGNGRILAPVLGLRNVIARNGFHCERKRRSSDPQLGREGAKVSDTIGINASEKIKERREINVTGMRYGFRDPRDGSRWASEVIRYVIPLFPVREKWIRRCPEGRRVRVTIVR